MSAALSVREANRLAPQEFPRFRAEGLAFLALTFAVGVGATNTGNNLLYLVLAMMLAFFIVSGLLAIQTLRGIHGTRRLPLHVHAGSPALGEVMLRNGKRFLGSYALELTDRTARGETAMLCFVPHAPPGEEIRVQTTYRFERRGVHRMPGVRISTRFPFGFLERARRVRQPDEIVVYPALAAVDVRGLERALGDGGEPARRKGSGQELYAIRPFVTGDAPRHIAWKQSARSDGLMVRDFESPARRRATVRLDLGSGAPTGSEHDEATEDAIRRAAGTVDALLERGWAVRFVTHSTELPHATGGEQLERVLEVLARLDPYGAPLEPTPAVATERGEAPPVEIQVAGAEPPQRSAA